MSEYGSGFQKELKPGILVTSKAVPEGATLGFFARPAGDPTKVVIVGANHSLFGDVGSAGVEVGQPKVSCCWCCACRVIGELRRGLIFTDLKVEVAQPASEAGTYGGSDIDCATVTLNDKRRYTNEAVYGMISGVPSGGFGVAAGDHVEKVGNATGHTKGTVLGLTHAAKLIPSGTPVPQLLLPVPVGGKSATEDGALPNINQIIVVPDPDPDSAARKTHFCDYGDSGAAVVNAAKQIIGTITRKITVTDEIRTYMNKFATADLPAHAGTLGVVSPIERVLAVLEIEVPTSFGNTSPSAGPLPDPAREAERLKELSLQLTLDELEHELRSEVLGPAVTARFEAHGAEVLDLLNRNRRIAVVWRRAQGPAFAAHCLRSVEDHRYRIPPRIHGMSATDLIERMADVLRRYGSRRLAAAIDACLPLARELVSDCGSVWELVERLRAAAPVLEAGAEVEPADVGERR